MKNKLNWYRIATYIHDLENMDVSDDTEENIINLHELQFKDRYIKSNILALPSGSEYTSNKLSLTAWNIFKKCREQIEETYDEWLNRHPIQNANSWTNMVIESLEESYGDEWFQNIMENGIEWGQLKLSPDTIKEYINRDYIISGLKEDFNYDPEIYEYQIKNYLDKNIKGWQKEGLSVIEFMKENNLEYTICDAIFSNYDNRNLMDYVYTFDENTIDIRKAISENLYRDYMIMWGSTIEGIIEEIEKNRNNLNSIGKGSTVQDMTQAVSLAINVMHASGNIMSDYGSENLSMKFLNRLHEGLVEQAIWEDELKEEFGIQSLQEETPLNLQRFR